MALGSNMETDYIILIWAILAIHYVADFVFQTNYQATNKSKSLKALSSHIGIYTLCLLPFGIAYALLNGGLHFITDFFTSKMSARFYAKKQIEYFWATIGADQLIHGLCLVGTINLI